MKTRKEAIEFCLQLPGAYEDYPFDDANWTVMRRKDTKRGFCWIFEHEGCLWMNVKTEPAWGDFFRNAYPAIRPAYHMNKTHWISLVLDGSLPEELIEEIVTESHRLCGRDPSPKKRR